MQVPAIVSFVHKCHTNSILYAAAMQGIIAAYKKVIFFQLYKTYIYTNESMLSFVYTYVLLRLGVSMS